MSKAGMKTIKDAIAEVENYGGVICCECGVVTVPKDIVSYKRYVDVCRACAKELIREDIYVLLDCIENLRRDIAKGHKVAQSNMAVCIALDKIQAHREQLKKIEDKT